jgi:hypothetical protein
MKYDPKKTANTVPPGRYEAVIFSVEEKERKAGGMMEVITYQVFANGKTLVVRDNLVEGATYANAKYKRLARALGREAEFKEGTFQAADHRGSNICLELAIEDSDEFGEQNTIKAYWPSAAASNSSAKLKEMADAGVKESDVPF